MKLETVTINDFRNIAFKKIELTTSSNFIFGKNMSGKTNTLNAIYWAFTGKTMDGGNDLSGIVPMTYSSGSTFVELEFDNFVFTREIYRDGGSLATRIYLNKELAKTNKVGEATLHAKLGLSEMLLSTPKDFDLIRFLLDPLYFDTISPSALRKFFYNLSGINFGEIAEQQNKAIREVLEKYGYNDPYKLGDAIVKEKKKVKKIIDGCKAAAELFPEVADQAADEEKKLTKHLKEVESDEALASRYALNVSKRVNAYYEKAMGIKVCLLEKGVGEDVFKDVCYPILPKSKLPYHLGSFAEKTYVGVKFINEVCLTYNIKPLLLLIDNMESMDEDSMKYLDSLGVQYLGAIVVNE